MANSFSGPVVIGWQVGVPSGWGTYGVNLALQLADKGIEVGLPFLAQTLNLTEDQEQRLRRAIADHAKYTGLGSQGKSHHLSQTVLLLLAGSALPHGPPVARLDKGPPSTSSHLPSPKGSKATGGRLLRRPRPGHSRRSRGLICHRRSQMRGVPCILSRNTGHLDIFGDDTCYGLDLQIPLGEVTGQSDLEGWGESSIEECV